MSKLLKGLSGLIHKNQDDEKALDDNNGKDGQGLCLIYAVNSLLGTDKYNKQQFDEIQYQISPEQAKKKQGHYDANTLMIILQKESITTKFYDVRNAKSFEITEDLIGNDLVGFIVNFEKGKFKIFSGRSWRCIKRIDNVWFDFDRNLAEPKPFKSQDGVTQYLRNLMTKHKAQLIICRWNL